MATLRDPGRLKLEYTAREVGRRLSAEMPEGVGFALLVFDFGEGGNLAWMSNGRREDMIKAVKEWLEKVSD